MARVYISKSNQANPEHLMELRQILKHKGHEIVEFQGGNYATFREKEMVNIQEHYVISHPECFSDGKDRVNLGRGIYGECSDAFDSGIPLFSYQGLSSGIRKIKSIQLHSSKDLEMKGSWQQRYGFALLATEEAAIPKPQKEPEIML